MNNNKRNNDSFTDIEIKTILNKANFPEGLNFRQQLKVLWWTIFKDKRFLWFLKKINEGMHIVLAFKDAEKHK